MPKYQLKPGVENFTVMSGPDAGKSFVRGRVYDRVPDGYADRFEQETGNRKQETGKTTKPVSAPKGKREKKTVSEQPSDAQDLGAGKDKMQITDEE